MTVYCVSYDLKKERDYSELFKKLEAYGNSIHPLESTWFIATEASASQIRDELKEAVDEDDKVIVIEVIKHWASYNLGKQNTEWLRKNI